MQSTPYMRPCLFFGEEAEAAAEFYTGLFGGTVHHVDRFPPGSPMPAGLAIVVIFEIFGIEMMALNGGAGNAPTPSPSVSLSVTVETQDEVDRYWAALLEGGGAEGRCGWITDRFGKMWQVIPEALPRLAGSGTGQQRARMHQAMMAMTKIDGPALEAAHAGSTKGD